MGWFRDIQLSGPFSLWNHRHAFIPVPGGCRVVDELEYRFPIGRLGPGCGRTVGAATDGDAVCFSF